MRRPENDGGTTSDLSCTRLVRNSSTSPKRKSARLASNVDHATPMTSAWSESSPLPKKSMSNPKSRATLTNAMIKTRRRIPSDSKSTTMATASTVNGRLKTLISRYCCVCSRIPSGVPMISTNASVNMKTPAE